jgi:hypothetical protein
VNLAAVAALALLLAVPSLIGLAEGSIDPDEAGLRLLLATACAAVAETVLRRFVDAVRPARVELPQEAGPGEG